MENNLGTNYRTIRLPMLQKVLVGAVGCACVFAFLWFFYRDGLICIAFSWLGLYAITLYTRRRIKRRQWELNTQFKDFLYFLSAGLTAGRSMPHAFASAHSALAGIYEGQDAYMVIELAYIEARLAMNFPLERCVCELAERSGLEDIRNFADVFVACTRKGGSMCDVIAHTSSVIKDRMIIKQEIDVMLQSKKSERLILFVAPIGLVLFLSVTAYDFMAPVFETLQGRLIMSLALLLIAGAYLWSNRLMNLSL